jgi:hypothetical protein
MLTFEQAREKARETIQELSRGGHGRECVILDEHVRECVRGWLFPYNTKKFLETGNPLDGMVGNGPVLVDRENGTVHVLPTGGLAVWLDEYDRTGMPPRAPAGMHWVGEGPALPFPSPRAVTRQASKAKYCGACGSPMPEDAKFCPNCGTDLAPYQR